MEAVTGIAESALMKSRTTAAQGFMKAKGSEYSSFEELKGAAKGLEKLFIGYMLILIVLGDNENCGCFSSVIKMNPLMAIVKNFILLAIALFVYKYSREKQNNKIVPSSLLVLSIIFVLVAAPIRSA